VTTGADAKRLVSALLAERGHANVLIAGASGVGKSTLVNAVFGAELAAVGQGRPVTTAVAEIARDGFPLTLFDTRGLEIERYAETLAEVEALILRRRQETDPNRHLHVAWLCVAEESRRVQEGESRLLRLLATHVPTLVLVTKARSDHGFAREVRRLMPEATDVLRVRALAEHDEEGHRLAPRGLAELVERTRRLLPEGQRRALIAAQRVAIERKREAGLEVVKRFERLAAGAGATPIPWVAAGVLVPVQLAMRDGIHAALGLARGLTDRDFLRAITVHGARRGNVAKALVGEVLKSAVLVGTAAGSALSGHAASVATRRTGTAYVSAICGLLDGASGPPDRAAILARFVEELAVKPRRAR